MNFAHKQDGLLGTSPADVCLCICVEWGLLGTPQKALVQTLRREEKAESWDSEGWDPKLFSLL
jgi:hypothetical protein